MTSRPAGLSDLGSVETTGEIITCVEIYHPRPLFTNSTERSHPEKLTVPQLVEEIHYRVHSTTTVPVLTTKGHVTGDEPDG